MAPIAALQLGSSAARISTPGRRSASRPSSSMARTCTCSSSSRTSISAARRATPVPASCSPLGTAPPTRSPRRSVPSPARRREALHRSVPPSGIAACGSVPCTRRCRPQVEGAQKASSLGATMDAVDARNDLRERRAQRAPRRLGGDARVSCGEPRTERASGRRVDAVTHATPPARRLLQRRGIDREATVRPTRSPRSRSRSPRAPTSLLPDLGLYGGGS